MATYTHNTYISKNAPIWPVTSIAFADSPYNASITDDRIILVDTSGGAVTVNLNSGDLTFQGVVFMVKDKTGNAGTNTITINVGTGETINGNATGAEITANWGSGAVLKPSVNSTNWISLEMPSSFGTAYSTL